jgi:hypothetical protein
MFIRKIKIMVAYVGGTQIQPESGLYPCPSHYFHPLKIRFGYFCGIGKIIFGKDLSITQGAQSRRLYSSHYN